VSAWHDEPPNGSLGDWVGGFLYEIAAAEIDLPHIVLCQDSTGRCRSFSGPYSTALEALVAAESEQRVELEANGGDTLKFQVAALYPALPSNGI
jgi:hypothetical protein